MKVILSNALLAYNVSHFRLTTLREESVCRRKCLQFGWTAKFLRFCRKIFCGWRYL